MMFRIHGVSSVSPRDARTDAATRQERSGAAKPAGARVDRIELSARAEELVTPHHDASQRAERIERIRREIASETYETDYRVDGTVERLFSELHAVDLRA